MLHKDVMNAIKRIDGSPSKELRLFMRESILILNFILFFLGGATTFLYSQAGFSKENCLECHEDIIDKKYVHASAKEFCTYCHNGHDVPSQNPYQLVELPNDLCILCHYKNYGINNRLHPVHNHPVVGAKDPIYPDKPFNCISCHNPHSSNMPGLFRYDYKSPPYPGQSCSICHWDIYGRGPKPQTPPWNQ